MAPRSGGNSSRLDEIKSVVPKEWKKQYVRMYAAKTMEEAEEDATLPPL